MRLLELIVEPDREDHIARHGVRLEEVREIVFGNPFIHRERQGYFRFTGQTLGGRYLTVFLALREAGVFSLVTARDASDSERRQYRQKRRR